MHTGRNDIFLIPVLGRYLLHAPLHGVTALMNGDAAAYLKRALASPSVSGVPADIARLALRLNAFPPQVPQPRTGPYAPDHLALLLTGDCNLRCRYCAPAADGDSPTMFRELCAAALRFFAKTIRENDLPGFSIYFHGGEPFYRWDLMQFCIARAEAHAEELGTRVWASATTNAFLSPKRAAWVADHFDFLIVSMDGPAEIHDRFRPTAAGTGSYETVAAAVDVFQERGVDFGLRCTVEASIAERIPEIADFFCTRFRPSVINFEPLVVSGRCEQFGLAPPDPGLFARGVAQAGAIARAHGVRLMLTTAQTDRLARSNCDVANDQCVITPDGLVSTCFGANERSSSHCTQYAVGAYDPATGTFTVDQEKVERVRTHGVESIPRCSDCFCKWHCSGGCRLFHTPPFCADPPVPMCDMTQKLTVWQLLCDIGHEEDADAWLGVRSTSDKTEILRV